MKEQEVIITIDGFEIRTNSLYQLINKPDPDAPDGYVEAGTTKLPSLGNGNTVACRYIGSVNNTGSGMYDTGLFEMSPMFATRNKTEVKEIVRKLQEYLITPYEASHGEGLLDNKNIDFWDHYGVNLYERRMFNTAHPEDLLDLWLALTSYQVVPKGKEGDPKYKFADYCVVDNEKVRDVKEERANLFMEAASQFGMLLAQNKKLLLGVLRYSSIAGVTSASNDANIRAIFHEWLKESHENGKLFLKYTEFTSTEDGREIVLMYSKLIDLMHKKVVKKNEDGIVYQHDLLGRDLKEAANNLVKNKDYEELYITLLEI